MGQFLDFRELITFTLNIVSKFSPFHHLQGWWWVGVTLRTTHTLWIGQLFSKPILDPNSQVFHVFGVYIDVHYY